MDLKNVIGEVNLLYRPEVAPMVDLQLDVGADQATQQVGEIAEHIGNRQHARLQRLLAELPAEQRDAFLLREEGGLSVAEIAEATGRSEEACRQLLRRALIKLELALEKRGADPR